MNFRLPSLLSLSSMGDKIINAPSRLNKHIKHSIAVQISDIMKDAMSMVFVPTEEEKK